MTKLTLGSVLGMIAKDSFEYHNGKIHTWSNHWIFLSQLPDLPKRAEVHLISNKDVDGKDLALWLRRKAIHCYNQEVGNGHPHFGPYNGKAEYWDLPYSECQKCQFHRKSSRGMRYPHCEWLKTQRGGSKGAADKVVGIVDEANRMVQEILK